MTPIEAAIQAATNAGTASGYVQALEDIHKNLDTQIMSIEDQLAGDPANTEQREAVVQPLIYVRDSIAKQIATGKERETQLKNMASATSSLAIQSVPDMANVRKAMALILGAG